MIKNDGSGLPPGVNWRHYDVSQLWDLVKNHHTDNHWRQVAAWRKTYELTWTHLSRLKQYRVSLTESWPPEKSEAASLYVAHLDKLIENVQQTYDTAQANYTIFSTATTAISQTREKLRKLYEKYAAKRQEKFSYELQTATLKNVPGASLGKPPATDAELEQLNREARSLMSGLSGELIEARVQIRQPTPYKPASGKRPIGDDDIYGEPSAPPVIPPILVTGGSLVTKPAVNAPPTGVQLPAPTAPTSGPVLGGTSPPLAIPHPGTVAPPGAIPPPGPASSIGAALVPPFSSGPNVSPFHPGAHTKSGGSAIAGPPRAMAPGGLIGGQSGGGLGQPGARPPIRQTNPVGGVIGESRVRQAGGAKNSIGPRRDGRSRREDEIDRRWDPDNLWETDEGVAPIVVPPSDPGQIDPGPAIGHKK
ncbi:hypothetical protein [Micromonospora polyrhachis]|uniref:Uncharacterized protein n=1 Tax=Micromonospora polyrhachis TaxID=1282883 RepID=A0A7W7WQL8_9ACTN|nr:hypothetical protein [Micromonospora polyrhachis]MBB4959974.1 hypothetical protein [Micromonospora polyrhachis]